MWRSINDGAHVDVFNLSYRLVVRHLPCQAIKLIRVTQTVNLEHPAQFVPVVYIQIDIETTGIISEAHIHQSVRGYDEGVEEIPKVFRSVIFQHVQQLAITLWLKAFNAFRGFGIEVLWSPNKIDDKQAERQ